MRRLDEVIRRLIGLATADGRGVETVVGEHNVIHGFNEHLNLHFRVNSLFHHLCS